MTVKELIEELTALDPNATVKMASDPEGNQITDMDEIGLDPADKTYIMTIHHLRTDLPHVVGHSGAYRCGKCASEAVMKRRREVKATLVKEHGGQCGICGYQRCIKALDFHHRDPELKKFGIASSSKSLDAIREEAAKCVLLCKNCHAEVESGVTEVPIVG